MRIRTRKTWRGALRARRGQAMISYAIITMLLLGSLTASMSLIVPRVVDALNSYSTSVYFCINAPF
jgi:hypothetical protein